MDEQLGGRQLAGFGYGAHRLRCSAKLAVQRAC